MLGDGIGAAEPEKSKAGIVKAGMSIGSVSEVGDANDGIDDDEDDEEVALKEGR